MAHQIDMSNGRANMFSGSNVTPWHKLGQVVEGRLTAADAIEAAGLDWNVDLAPVHAFVSGHMVELEGLRAPFRTDTGALFGTTVSDSFGLFQNSEAFDLLDNIVDSGAAHYETAGSLRGGADVWMMLKPNASEILLNGDAMHKYLLCTTSHDGTGSLRIKPVVTRVVCANTLSWSLHEKASEFRTRHTSGIGTRVQQAREALGLSFAYFEEFEATARKLADINLSLDGFRELVDELVPLNEDGEGVSNRALTIRLNKRHGMVRSWRSEISGVEPTAWKAIQAINTWELWGSEDRANAEKQARRIVGGTDAPLTQRAVRMLVNA